MHLFFSITFIQSYTRFFGKKRIKSVFFTSNSFATEVLRWYLILHHKCSSIIEILHGIPTLSVEHYFSTLLQDEFSSHPRRKHFFIPQIPISLNFGIFKTQLVNNNSPSINTYINKFCPTPESVEREFFSLISPKRMAPETLVISFMGGTVLEGDFFKSDIFKIECFIIQQVRKMLTHHIQKPCVFLYAAHPKNHDAKKTQLKILDIYNVIFYPKTIFAWFFSDIALTLFSSSIFEAAFFTANSFIPTTEGDNSFHKTTLESLGTLRYLDDCKNNFIENLGKFIAEKSTLPIHHISQKTASRFSLLDKNYSEKIPLRISPLV